MDEKSKKKKKLKQKQKQRQKQNQTVIVNVHSGKSKRSQGNPDKPRVQIPPPIHQVYASPIHDLVPQMFSKEGRQTIQQTLPQQLEKILQNQEQSRQGNVLGPIKQNPSPFIKKSSRPPIRILAESVDLSDFEMLSDFDKALVEQKTKRLGRKPGSKNREKIMAEAVGDSPEVFGVAEVISEPEYSDKKQIPDEFNREQMLLRPSQSMYSENRYQPLFNSRPKTLFDTPRPPEQPLGANTNRTSKKSKSGKKLNSEYEE